jgi:excisionase family DNA binding protein
MAQGLERGGGGAGGMATEMAVGFAIAKQMMEQGFAGGGGSAPATGSGGAGASPAPPAASSAANSVLATDLLSPAEAAELAGVPEADLLAVIESGELPARKIGSSIRIRRSALEAFLAE